MILNGLYKKNIRFADFPNQGFVKSKNMLNDGKFLIQMDDAMYGKDSVYRTFKGKKAPAVIASALNTIKLPNGDFDKLAVFLNSEHNEIVSDEKTITSNRPCSHYNLGNFTIQINGLHFNIPQFHWTREVDQQCKFLF